MYIFFGIRFCLVIDSSFPENDHIRIRQLFSISYDVSAHLRAFLRLSRKIQKFTVIQLNIKKKSVFLLSSGGTEGGGEATMKSSISLRLILTQKTLGRFPGRFCI